MLVENGSPENLPGGKEGFYGAEEGFIDALLSWRITASSRW